MTGGSLYLAPTNQAISSITVSGTVATLTVATSSGIPTGQGGTISGVSSPAALNGSFSLTNLNTTQVTVQVPTGTANGTGTAMHLQTSTTIYSPAGNGLGGADTACESFFIQNIDPSAGTLSLSLYGPGSVLLTSNGSPTVYPGATPNAGNALVFDCPMISLITGNSTSATAAALANVGAVGWG